MDVNKQKMVDPLMMTLIMTMTTHMTGDVTFFHYNKFKMIVNGSL